MHKPRRQRAATALAIAMIGLLGTGCGEDSDTQSSSEEAPSIQPATFVDTVDWKTLDGWPDESRLEELRATLSEQPADAGTTTLDSCPLGSAEEILVGLPPVWSSQDRWTASMNSFSMLGGDRGMACDGTNNWVHFGELTFTPDMNDPDDVNQVLADAFSGVGGAEVSIPTALYSGTATTHCYTNATTDKPACAAFWFYEDIGIRMNLFGDGATAQVAADWLATALPAIVGGNGSAVADPDTPDMTGETYTISYEDADGFALTAELVVRPAVHGTDTEAMSSEWALVGGEGAIPCQDADLPNDSSTLTAIETQTSAYAFGTFSVANATDGFSAPDFTWQFVTGSAKEDEDDWVGTTGEPKAMGVEFSDGTRCEGMSTGGFMLNPNMEGRDDWGPVPVVFAYSGVFTPNQPDGDASMLESYPVALNVLADESIVDSQGNEVSAIPIRLAQ